jgi:hypothetical protein
MTRASIDLQSAMIEAAIALWGQPTHTSREEYRFGREGAKSLDLVNCRWCDHEPPERGGYWPSLYRLAYGHDPGPSDIKRLGPEPVRAVKAPIDPKTIEKILGELIPPKGTAVQRYLAGRGIDVRELDNLGYHRRLWHKWTDTNRPAMVASMHNAKGRIVAIHRTWLQLKMDGVVKAKIEPNKAYLGPANGCVVRLAPAAPAMVLGEGIETTASAMRRFRLPGWAACTGGNLEVLVLPDLVREVIIAADNDKERAGEEAAIKAAWRFISEGRKVEIIMPREVGLDFNDLEEARP